MNIKLGLDVYLENLSNKKILAAEEQVPFKACVIDVIYLRVSDGEYSISAIYSEECREEFKSKFEYLSLNELENVNIMITKYDYILHEPVEEHLESYRGMWLQIVIHSLKPLLNESPISGAGINVLHDKSIKAGLKKYKYKRMQSILMSSDRDFKNAEMSNQSVSVSMRSDSEHSQYSSVSSQLPSLTAVFEKIELSDRNLDSSENNDDEKMILQGVYDLNSHSYLHDNPTSSLELSTYAVHAPGCTFTKLVEHNMKKEVENIMKLSQKYVQEMSEEDKKLRQLKLKMEFDQERNRAMKLASKDPVVQRINKVINKPSESNVHQRGTLDVNKPRMLFDGIKTIIDYERKRKGEALDEDKTDEIVAKIEAENKNGQTGSLFWISTFKSYLEWFHLKKLNVPDIKIAQELGTNIDPKTMFLSRNERRENRPMLAHLDPDNKSEELKIKTLPAIKSEGPGFEEIMKRTQDSLFSGKKRPAPTNESTSSKDSNPHKRKYFGEESENKLAKLFQEKLKSRKATKSQTEKVDESESESDHNSEQSSRFLTPLKQEPVKEEVSVKQESPENTFKLNMYREDEIRDTSSKDHSSELQTPERSETPMKMDTPREDSSISSELQSERKQRGGSKYCGRRNKIENKRNKTQSKVSIHERLAHSIYNN